MVREEECRNGLIRNYHVIGRVAERVVKVQLLPLDSSILMTPYKNIVRNRLIIVSISLAIPNIIFFNLISNNYARNN